MARTQWDTTEIRNGLRNYERAIDNAMMGIAEYNAPRMETDAKNEAQWTDRTGNARQTLNARAWQAGDVTIIQLSHGMFYGLFLEIKNQGRYAIVIPTLQRYYPIVWQMVKQVLS